ncbi:DNA-binding LacI/PurR family transcriptional regulator [Microbacterium halimionae]|uniref:DNA-binding LacI/PurR family transcriptional regulator n=1 Tax=Microbacterium halimionae TaxID=1526413 RepID=A0A7W3PL17_9MICO|nr:LacI family DNA-binding transcriptional regulator [Microbacterium halimionae]MBA8815414.1 DNA-binding LacI/PurR family transcriptional regulator [Microbacterium halimionae]NII95461.1 DNA-binding LacI/PurR family transcriptional regulator [Microbacterium halimionae]
MSGITDVAVRAGVSKSTASRALSGVGYVAPDTRERVVAAAAALGYVPSTSAVTLATGRTRNIGVIIPYANRWFFAEVLEGIQSTLLSEGFDLTLYDAKPGTVERRRVFDDFLARKRFDGLIAVGLEPQHDELERLVAIGRPIVSVVGKDEETSGVAIDDVRAAQRATEHLIALGHRSIVFLGAGDTKNWAHVDRTRLRGYEMSMRDAGLGHAVRHVPSEVTLPGGYSAAVDLLSDASRPTGIVAVCDEVAIGAIIAARRLGITVPTALSVIGIDDHEYAEMFSLTTLEQVPREQGARAARLVIDQIKHPELSAVFERLPARLIVRNSTAAIDPTASAITASV